MNVVHLKTELIALLQERRKNAKIVGFVPTMGALHTGHLSLINRAQEKSDVVVISIFVNPTQFNDATDLKNYPRNLTNDLKILGENYKDLIIFAPDAQEIYGDHLEAQIYNFGTLATVMEGKYRTGHFEGVGTVLQKLFTIINPDKAFFGEKDYQQFLIVKQLVTQLALPIKVIGCPINREESGLARSSRNKRLTPTEQQEATLLYKSLNWTKNHFKTTPITSIIEKVTHDFKDHPSFELEYFEIADANTLASAKNIEPHKKYRAFLAAKIGNVRLIDNMALN